jgi:hypothetical protein
MPVTRNSSKSCGAPIRIGPGSGPFRTDRWNFNMYGNSGIRTVRIMRRKPIESRPVLLAD